MSSARSGSASKNGRPSIEKRILRMRERNQQMDHRISELESIVERQNVENGHLSHALDMQAEQYGVQGNLLYDLSKNQRENAMFRDEVAQRDQVIENMGHDIGSLNQTVNELSTLRQTLETELHQKTEDCLVLREDLDAMKGENEDMKNEREELINLVEERTKELDELRSKFERITLEKTDLEQENERHTEESTTQIQQLQKELRTMNQRCEDLQTVTDYAENQLQGAIEKCHSLEHQLQQSMKSGHNMESEISKLQSQLDYFVQQNLSNEKTRGDNSRRMETMQQEIESLKGQLEERQEMIENTSMERSKVEADLREKISDHLKELNSVYEKRDTLQTKCNEWQDAVQELEQKVQELEDKMEEADQRARRSEQSKSMMQKTLLGQISSLREKVASQEQDSEKQKEKGMELERENNRLKMLVEATKKARDSMTHSQQARLQLVPQLEQTWKRQSSEFDNHSEFDNSSTAASYSNDSQFNSHGTESDFEMDSSSWTGPTLREQLASLSSMSPSLLAHTGSLSRTIVPKRRTILDDYDHQSNGDDDNHMLEESDHGHFDSQNESDNDGDVNDHGSGSNDDTDLENSDSFRVIKVNNSTNDWSQGEEESINEEDENPSHGLIQRSAPTSPFARHSSPVTRREQTDHVDSAINNSFDRQQSHRVTNASRLSTTSSADYRRTMPRPSNPEPFQRSGVDDMKFSSRSESCNSSSRSSTVNDNTVVSRMEMTTTTAAAVAMRIDNAPTTSTLPTVTTRAKQRFTREDGKPLTLFELAEVSENSILNE